MPDVAALLRSALASEQRLLLRRATEESARRRVRLYLVGGAVRDALLGLPVADVDLVSAPGGADFGRELAGALGGEVVASSQFGTHKIREGGITFDLAMARTESYAHPGALPSVRPAGILDDLARRDFTINAMAVEVRGESWGDLQDEFGGLADLRRGLVRTLHDGSFRDDATRILRAARYAGRYGYRIEEATQRALDRDLAYLDAIKGDRLRHELERVFDEPRAAPILRLLRDAGVLRAINPSLGADEAALARIDEVALRPERGPRPVMLSLLVSSLPAEAAPALVRRLNMGADWARVVRDTLALRDIVARLTGCNAPACVPARWTTCCAPTTSTPCAPAPLWRATTWRRRGCADTWTSCATPARCWTATTCWRWGWREGRRWARCCERSGAPGWTARSALARTRWRTCGDGLAARAPTHGPPLPRWERIEVRGDR